VSAKTKDYYWYSCSLEKVNQSSITTRYKDGTLDADSPLAALDELHAKYKDTVWHVATARICTVDKDGEVVATVESGPREPFVPHTAQNHTCEMYKWSTVFNGGRYETAFD
jgi:hypothetical protein